VVDDPDGRWEYDYLEEPPRHIRDLIDDLNEHGAEGWEAFAAFSVGGASLPNVVVPLKRWVH
jgi:hypothetical protein